MSLSTFLKLVNKAFKFTVSRPLQRFNIENRAVKYLGPEAKKFVPSPRAIGPLSGLSLKELPRYPQLSPGFKNISQRRRTAIEGKKSEDHVPKSYSEDEVDDNLVIEASNKLDVVKTIARIEPPEKLQQIDLGVSEETPLDGEPKPSHRPLPKSTNLPFQDLNSIWEIKRTPPGRLNLDMLQELMINRLADNVHWTPKAIAERYNIREEYAEKLISYMKQIRIRISPRLAKNMDLVGMNNPQYNAAKHIIFHVDKSMRTELDRKFDSMYLPKDELPDDVKEVIDQPGTLQLESDKRLATTRRGRLERPKPLRVASENESQKPDSSQPPPPPPLVGQDSRGTNRKQLEASPKSPGFGSNN